MDWEKASCEQLENSTTGIFGESINWPELDVAIHLEGFFDFKKELNYAKL